MILGKLNEVGNLTLFIIQKNELTMPKDLNLRAKTTKVIFRRKYWRKTSCHWILQRFLSHDTKNTATKIHTLTLSKLETCASKDTMNIMKRQP
jgi:hypothetical protein